MSEPPTDHRNLEVIAPTECDDLLAKTAVGRVAFISGGGPLILPVTHRFVDGRVVFRTSHGEKLAAADRHETCGFEIDEWDAETNQGWSVSVQGSMSRVTDDATVARYEALGLEPWADEPHRHFWVEIRPDYVSGRRTRTTNG